MNLLLEIGLSNAIAAGVLALVASVASHFCRRPAITHGLWLLVLLKLITPPLVHVPLPWPTSAEPAAAAPTDSSQAWVAVLQVPMEEGEEAPEQQPENDPFIADPDGPVEIAGSHSVNADLADPPPASLPESSLCSWPYRAALLGLWLGGAVVWLVLAVTRLHHFHRMLRHAQPAPTAVQAQAERLAERLGLVRCPGVWLVPGRLSPMLWAISRPARLLLPADLLNQLSPEQRATLLAHELAHLKRGDHWVRGFEMLVTALYWWNPVVWWARHELREAEEQCCDAWVVWALPGAGRAYATALMDTLDFLSQAPAVVPALASGLGPVHDLKRRLTMIMRGTTPRSLTWTGCLGLAVLAALLLPVLPTRAQTERLQKEIEERLKAERARKEAVELELVLVQQAGDKEKHAQMEQARAKLQQMQAQVEKARAELKQAEEQLRRAMEQMAQIEGRGGKAGEKIIIMIKDDDGKVRTIEVPSGAADALRRLGMEGRPPVPARPPQPPVPPDAPRTFTRPVNPPFGGGSVDDRLRDLEKRLDMIMKQLESMRENRRPPADGRKNAPPRPDDEDILFFKPGPGPITVPFKAVPVPGPADRLFLITPGPVKAPPVSLPPR